MRGRREGTEQARRQELRSRVSGHLKQELRNTQAPVLPTQVPITFGDSSGTLGGDGNGPVYVSLDSPFIQQPDGTPQIDRLGTSNVAPLLVGGQINPALGQNHIQVIKDTHGKTSQLSQADLDALVLYLKSLQ